MPQALDPNYRIPIVLDFDRDKENPPTFFFSVPTMQSEAEIADTYEEAIDADESEELRTKLVDLICDWLTGWKNMGNFVYSDPPDLSFLRLAEAIELIKKLIASGRVNHDEKKSSE